MDRWLAYINERYPQILWGAIALGVALSGNHLNGARFQFLPVLVVVIGTWFFFLTLRIMNDYKDFDIDRRAHPERPLPKGLISKKEASKAILFLQIFLFAYSQLVWITVKGTAALAFIALSIYALLYYRNFLIPSIIGRYPFFKGFLTQSFAFPLAFFAVSASQPERVFGVMAWSYAIVLFGSFLVYDICRKLNPHSHPILGTYIHFYGFNKTFLVAVIALFICSIGAFNMHMEILLWPVETLVFISLGALFFNPQLYRGPDLTSTVSLLVHVWAGIF